MRFSEQLAQAVEARQLGLFGEPVPAPPPPKPVEVPAPAASAAPPPTMREAKAKVKELEKKQAAAKKANAEYRKWLKKGMSPAEAVGRLTGREVKKEAQRLLRSGELGRWPYENQIYTVWYTRELAKQLANAREQVRDLLREKGIPTMKKEKGRGWKFAEDLKMNAVTFSFDEKPPYPVFSALDKGIYVRSDDQKFWYRKADQSGRLSAERVLKIIKKVMG